MDSRSVTRAIVTILIIVVGACGRDVFAQIVHTYSDQFYLPIPAEPDDTKGWMDDAIIEIPDHFTIHDLDVGISLTHESLFDLQIILQSPAGTNVALNLAGNLAFIVRGEDDRLGPVGGSLQMFFDDGAEFSIEEATEPFVGPFRPVWNLSLFDQEDAFGQWRLRIYDSFYADTGTLDGFEIMITTPEPATVALLVFGAGLIGLFNSRRRLY